MSMQASRIFHVNSNCRDIDRSLGFYRDVLGFTASSHPMPSRPQRGDAFGLDEVLWDGWILQGDLGYGGLSLDLLEWQVPPPGGSPPQSMHEPGFHRLCFTVPDLDDTLDVIRAAGLTILVGATAGDSGIGSARLAIVEDPDGVPVEILAGSDRRISHVVINCRDLDASVAYYRDVLGLELDAVRPAGPTVCAYGVDAPVTARSARLDDPASPFSVELVQWIEPAMPPIRARRANDVGLYRMAWSTSDCAASEIVVRAAGSVPFAPTGELSVGDHLPLLLVLFWPGPDGECLELIEVPGNR